MRRPLIFALVAITAGCGSLLSISGDDTPSDSPDAAGDSLRSDGSPIGPSDGGADASKDAAEQCVDTQTQKNHCGQCNHSCLGGACTAGKCQPVTLATGETSPLGIAVDDTYVYWTRFVDPTGAVVRMPKAGLGSPQPFEAMQRGPRAIAVSGGYVYWTTDQGVGGAGQVNREAANKDGGITTLSNEDHPSAIAVGTGGGVDAVGWTLASNGAQDTGKVRLANLGLGQAIDKVPGMTPTYTITNPTAIAFDPSDATWVYYGEDLAGGYVRRAGRPVIGNEQVMSPSPHIVAIAVLGTHVYWTASDGLHRAFTAGGLFAGQPVNDLQSATGGLYGLVADAKANALYYVAGTGEVYRLDGNGSGPGVLIATGPPDARLMAQDDAALYWIATGGASPASILKLAKPP